MIKNRTRPAGTPHAQTFPSRTNKPSFAARTSDASHTKITMGFGTAPSTMPSLKSLKLSLGSDCVTLAGTIPLGQSEEVEESESTRFPPPSVPGALGLGHFTRFSLLLMSNLSQSASFMENEIQHTIGFAKVAYEAYNRSLKPPDPKPWRESTNVSNWPGSPPLWPSAMPQPQTGPFKHDAYKHFNRVGQNGETPNKPRPGLELQSSRLTDGLPPSADELTRRTTETAMVSQTPDPSVPSDPITDFGRAVRLFRRSRGLTQSELATKGNFHRSYVASVEAGRRNATLETIAALSEALATPIASFFSAPPDRNSARVGWRTTLSTCCTWTARTSETARFANAAPCSKNPSNPFPLVAVHHDRLPISAFPESSYPNPCQAPQPNHPGLKSPRLGRRDRQAPRLEIPAGPILQVGPCW
jgi:transcriptional regulator with XRE-family HTH domain